MMRRLPLLLPLLPLLLLLAVPFGVRAQMITTGYRQVFSTGGGGGTVTHVQACSVQDGSTAYPTSITCTFQNPVAAGDLLFINLANAGGLPEYSFSGDTGTLVNNIGEYSWGSTAEATYYILSASGGETSITATFTGNQVYPAVSIDEFHCSTTCSLDVAGTSATAQGTGTALASGSITTTTNGDLVIGIIGGQCCGTTFTAGTGYTIDPNSMTPYSNGNEYQIQTTAGAITATAAQSTSGAWMMGIVAFKP